MYTSQTVSGMYRERSSLVKFCLVILELSPPDVSFTVHGHTQACGQNNKRS